MIYKNIEIHNVAAISAGESGGACWSRYPDAVCEGFEKDGARIQAKNCSGVELRFILKGESAKLRIRSTTATGSYHIYRGGIQGGWYDHEGKVTSPDGTEILIERREQGLVEQMHKDQNLPWDPNLIRIIFDRGRFELLDVEGDVCPPAEGQTPKKTILFYGSSITHGSNSMNNSNAWTAWVAHALSMDALNKGLAGSCRMEETTVSYLGALGREGKWDVAVLELGINACEWEEERRRIHVEKTLDHIAGQNPKKPIFVISPFYCDADYNGRGEPAAWRETIRAVVKERAYPNVTYIPGNEILSDMRGISTDGVHPSIYGIAEIAEKLTARMRAVLEG